MDSFKLYLPSNSSSHHYPSNKASDFKTILNNPIRLKGSWEVGVESLYYNNDIGDINEDATISVYATYPKEVFVNEIYPYRFKVLSDNKWSYDPIVPDTIPKNPTSFEEVLTALNSINEKLLVNKKKVFNIFTTEPNRSCFQILTHDIGIKMTAKMSTALGFDHRIHFSREATHCAYYFRKSIKTLQKLKEEDYAMTFFMLK